MYIKFEDIREMSDQIRLLTGDDQDTFFWTRWMAKQMQWISWAS